MVKPAFVFDGRKILDHAALASIGFHVETIGQRPGYYSNVGMEYFLISGNVTNHFVSIFPGIQMAHRSQWCLTGRRS